MFYFVSSFLPAPTQLSQDQLEAEEKLRAQKCYSTALVSSRREPPPYGHRKGLVPRSLEVYNVNLINTYMVISNMIKLLLSDNWGVIYCLMSQGYQHQVHLLTYAVTVLFL